MELPTVFLADLTALTAAPKLKYSSLIRCLQRVIYFDSPMPAVDAMLWKQNIHTALSITHRHVPFCFPSLILAASATKWPKRRALTLQSPLLFIPTGLVYALD